MAVSFTDCFIWVVGVPVPSLFEFNRIFVVVFVADVDDAIAGVWMNVAIVVANKL